MIGKTISHYQVTEQLGKGGMGVVYKAWDTALERAVALKMLHSTLAQDEIFLKRFRAEARALAQLENINIVSVFDLLETETGFFIVMQYVEGETLADKIGREGALPHREALAIFEQILNAVAHAHRAGIIHRDLKPGNVMLTPQGIVKVADFGLAKVQQGSILTLSRITGGTLHYMPPEQIRNLAHTDQRSDIYSAGMTLYEMLAGRLPFENKEDIYELSKIIVKKRFPSPAKYQPAVPRNLARMVMKAISKEPEKRYQQAEELSEAIRSFQQAHGLVAPSAGEFPRHRRWLHSLSLYSLMAGLVLIAISLIILFVPGLKERALQTLGFSSYARLTVQTDPPGATVILNGKKYQNPTLLNRLWVKADTTYLQVIDTLGSLRVDTSFVLQPRQDLFLSFELLPKPPLAESDPIELPVETGGVEIKSEPAGAAISWDGKTVGKTFYRDNRIPAGRYRLLVRLPGYKDALQTVEVRSGEVARIQVRLEKLLIGRLAVNIRPSGTIYVDGELHRENTGQYSADIPAGIHHLKIVNPGLGVWEDSIRLEPGGRYEKEIDFHQEYELRVSAFDTAGEALFDAEIFADGINTGETTPALIKLRFGQHEIAVRLKGYELVDHPRKINLESNLADPLEFKLRKLP